MLNEVHNDDAKVYRPTDGIEHRGRVGRVLGHRVRTRGHRGPPEPALVVGDDVEATREEIDQQSTSFQGRAGAVEEEQRRSGPAPLVVDRARSFGLGAEAWRTPWKRGLTYVEKAFLIGRTRPRCVASVRRCSDCFPTTSASSSLLPNRGSRPTHRASCSRCSASTSSTTATARASGSRPSTARNPRARSRRRATAPALRVGRPTARRSRTRRARSTTTR